MNAYSSLFPKHNGIFDHNDATYIYQLDKCKTYVEHDNITTPLKKKKKKKDSSNIRLLLAILTVAK